MKAYTSRMDREKILFWTLSSAFVFCIGFYMFCIHATIQNVVLRENLEDKATALSLEIGNKEFEYITMKNSVNLNLAYSLGFSPVSNKTFISKKSVGYISYRSNEI
jgi:hypothetical protein